MFVNNEYQRGWNDAKEHMLGSILDFAGEELPETPEVYKIKEFIREELYK